MLQLKNKTPFAAKIAIFPNEEAVDTLYIMSKATFSLGKQWVVAKEQTCPQEADTYYGEPAASSLKYPSDYHTGKAATDIVMLGSACALEKKTVTQLDVSLSVGELHKTVRVFGDRQWQNGSITSPKPFETMRMRYEKAFGGQDVVEEEIRAAEERNPLGVGFMGKKSKSGMEGCPLPNIEDPRYLIRHMSDTPPPACFAPIAPNWRPRLDCAGTYDDVWVQERAPYLPDDYSNQFMNSAHPDLVYPGYMQGGEPVVITNMNPSGELAFNLPLVKLKCEVDIGNTRIETKFNLETLVLEPNQLNITIVWRASYPCDKKALKIKEIGISLLR